MNKDSIVLIAEQDEEHFDIIRKSLLRAGVDNQILHFADGRKIIDYLVHIDPESASQQHVLFVDVDLPEVGGVEVLEKIRQDSKLSKIPGIVLTAVDDQHTIDRCYNLGCSTYMVKPEKNEDFAESIQDIGAFLSVIETTSIK